MNKETISDLIEEHKLINWMVSIMFVTLALFAPSIEDNYRNRLMDGAFLLLPAGALGRGNTSSRK